MKYHIAIAECAKDLETCVNQLIQEGWDPLGGIAIDEHLGTMDSQGEERTERTYAQAMIRHDSPKTF